MTGPVGTPPLLNVDDDEAGRYAKTRVLRNAGFTVAEAATGAEALALVARLRPPLVLLDVKLPDISGIEVCRRIKRDHAGTLVLQVSAVFTGGDDRVRGLEGGADSYLTHPVEPTELVAVVRALLRLRQAEREQASQRQVLEMVAADASLGEILEAICRQTDEQFPGAVCAMTLFDPARGMLHSPVSPGMPELAGLLEGLPVAEGSGGCGTACFRRAPVVAADIAADPLFQDCREALLGLGLRACWSKPILSGLGTVLGCFSLFHRAGPSLPAPEDLARRDALLHLATLAIERRHTEKTLRALTERLEERVAERTRDLAAATLRLEQETAERARAEAALAQARKMEALGQLAGGIAHDFNNVLQAVAGAARLIRRRPDEPEVVGRLAAMAIDAAERGAAVTRRLLAFARRGELRAATLELGPMLRELREVLRHGLGPGIEIGLDLPADGSLPGIFVDKGQLETVLVNLAANARDALPEGQGRIVVSARAEQVAVPPGQYPAALAPGGYVCIAVRDSGTGMDAATLARSAEPFFTTKPQGKGTGLGLSMAKGFAEQSGGAFEIDSTLGQGTTVTLWLPQAAPEVVAPLPGPGVEPASRAVGQRPIRLLVVDDEAMVRGAIVAELAERGYQVTEAAGGVHALALLDAAGECDVLVTDLAMPEIDGLALLREVRRRRPGMPVVLLTGHAGEGARLADAGGGFVLLRKPVTPEDLMASIAALLAGRAPSVEG
jgi:DNA-binding response OmpR family regulator/signal transduction histidine kinase